VLEHERLPFVSYPYEWSFEMLRDAALLQLDLVLAGLDEGIGLKDASAYNVQWKGASPGSSTWPRSSAPKAAVGGYRQFCQMPSSLLLQAYRDVPFQRGCAGTSTAWTPKSANLLSTRDYLRAVYPRTSICRRRRKRYNSTTGRAPT
jgi:hypothetical protein